MTLPIYIDIDGVLTKSPHEGWGEPVKSRIRAVRRLLDEGVKVVIWSARGEEYAREFARLYGLHDAVCLGKPSRIVDDNPRIRPVRLFIVPPEEFFHD